MYREIVTPTDQNNMIQIPKEYWNQQVEILVLPLNKKEKNIKRNLQELLSLESIDIEEIKAKNKLVES